MLSRGLIGGHWSRDRAADGDFRTTGPRFQGDNLDQNLRLVERLRALASDHGASLAELAIAWALDRGNDIVPLIGARRRDRLAEALGALSIRLTEADRAAIEAAVPREAAAGDRYDAHQMAHLDSERG